MIIIPMGKHHSTKYINHKTQLYLMPIFCVGNISKAETEKMPHLEHKLRVPCVIFAHHIVYPHVTVWCCMFAPKILHMSLTCDNLVAEHSCRASATCRAMLAASCLLDSVRVRTILP